MKIKIIIFLILPTLLSTRCKLEEMNMEFENKSKNNLILTNCKDTSSLRLQLNQKIENSMDINSINYIKKRRTTKTVFNEYDLDFYAFYMNSEKHYKFFFLTYEKVDDNIIFTSSMDSISFNANDMELGENKINYFDYEKNKLIFKTPDRSEMTK